MAGGRTGTPTIIKATRVICRMVNLYGAGDLEASTTTAFAAAISALVLACAAFEALDDYPGKIDHTAPYGAGDIHDA